MARPVTMARVAEAAGVSVMTVSYAFNKPDRVADDTRRLVLETAAKLGYQGPNAAASALRTGKSHQLGVVLGEHLTYAFEDPQATAFLAGISQECVARELGITLIPVSGDNDATRVTGVDVAGYVVWTTAEDNPILDALARIGRPVVVSGGPARPGWGLVALDDRAAAKSIAQIALVGARHPAVIALPQTYERTRYTAMGPAPDPATFPVTRARLQGFADAISATELAWADIPVAFLSRNDRSEAASTVRELLAAHPQTDAIITMSDQIALGALDALSATNRRVPADVAVTGWDDGFAADQAGLTTVSQSLLDQGAACARWVLDTADGVATAPVVTANWHITERTSTRTGMPHRP